VLGHVGRIEVGGDQTQRLDSLTGEAVHRQTLAVEHDGLAVDLLDPKSLTKSYWHRSFPPRYPRRVSFVTISRDERSP
jgi:hypothetical protein